MSWWGKLVGGAFGFVLGGPLGALIGAAVGHSLDHGLRSLKELPPGGQTFDDRERIQTAFFTTTFSVMGHLAKADGRVSPAEIRVARNLMDYLGLDAEMRRAAQRLFTEGKSADFPLTEVLEQFRRECRRSRDLVLMFVEIQVQAAYADGAISQPERRLLREVCRRLGVPEPALRHIEDMVQAQLHFRRRDRHRAPTNGGLALEDAYAILAVGPSSSDAEVKRAYRRLMSQHHPDKLVAKGLPEEMMKVATERTQEIKRAYDRIKQARSARAAS